MISYFKQAYKNYDGKTTSFCLSIISASNVEFSNVLDKIFTLSLVLIWKDIYICSKKTNFGSRYRASEAV